MIEQSQKRTYNAKTYDLENGDYRIEAHAGHIHYFNKLGVGDKQKRFREIDFTLQWDDARRGWFFEYHNFQPFIPEYADDWVEFRDLYENKDQTLKFKATAGHIKGRLVGPDDLAANELEKLTSENCVIYDEAFGKGIDYIVYFTRSMLKKVVRVRDGFKPTKDTEFEFEIDFPDVDIKRGIDDNSIEYVLDKTKAKEFDTEKRTLIGDTKQDGTEGYSYLQPFYVWDSTDHHEIIKVKYSKKGNKSYLTKILTKNFIEASVGNIYTDDSASYYTGAGDGTASSSGISTWNAVHDQTSSSQISYTSTTAYCTGHYQDPIGYGISRMFLPIDTSALDDSALISAATLTVYCHSVSGTGGYTGVVQTTQASTSSVTYADFDNCGAVDSPTEGSARVNITTTGSKVFTLDATGRGWISLTGYTKLGLRTIEDLDDSAPATGGFNGTYLSMRMSEYTGTTYDPKLSITYTLASTSNDERAAKITGIDTANDERAAKVTGKLTDADERDAKITGIVGDVYTREVTASLGADDTNLSGGYSEQDYTDVGSDDNAYVDLNATSTDYMVNLFKKYNTNDANEQIDATVIAKSTLAPTSSIVYLQVYNRNSTTWETLDSDSTTAENTEFTLSGSVTSDLAYYFDVNYVVALRIYQEVT